jgi:hypothetical protein
MDHGLLDASARLRSYSEYDAGPETAILRCPVKVTGNVDHQVGKGIEARALPRETIEQALGEGSVRLGCQFEYRTIALAAAGRRRSPKITRTVDGQCADGILAIGISRRPGKTMDHAFRKPTCGGRDTSSPHPCSTTRSFPAS